MLTKIRYELSVLRDVVRIFGFRKSLRFIVYMPSAILRNENRIAYEKIAPCKVIITGKEIVLPHPDAKFLQEVIVEKCYTCMPNFEIKNDDVVVDLGANIGIFSIMAGLKANVGRVIALEPEERNFRFLVENIRSSMISNVSMHRLAISQLDGLCELYVANSGNNTLLPNLEKQVAWIQKIESISMSTLVERFDLPEIDFLKVDIEGAEFEIFLEDSWLERVQKIAMEVHVRAGNPNSILTILKKKNFEVETRPAYGGNLYFYGTRRE